MASNVITRRINVAGSLVGLLLGPTVLAAMSIPVTVTAIAWAPTTNPADDP